MKTIKIFFSLCWLFFCGWSLGADCQSTVPLGNPIITQTTATIQVKYTIVLGNNTFSPGDRCLITHDNNNLFFIANDQTAAKLNTIKKSKIFFERVPTNNSACAGNNWPNNTPCPAIIQRNWSAFVAPGSFSYLIPNDTVGILYDVIYEFSGNAFGAWKFCPSFSTATRGTPSNPSRETTITPACATGVPNIPTCGFVVPSTVNLGNAKPDAWRPLLDTTRVNATNFNIAINCSQNWTTKFTPTVTMKFEKPLGTTCFASNEFPRADATDATIEIIRDLQGFTQLICPTTATSPTTLAFKVNDPASTPQPYSDFITLQAAFRGASGDRRPKTGPFSTRATFTVKYE